MYPSFLFIFRVGSESMLFTQIKTILKTLWAICRLRQGPENLPHSAIVFAVIAIIYTLLHGAFGALVGMLFVWLILKYKNLETRFIQTTSALFGASSILLILIFPFQLMLIAYTAGAQFNAANINFPFITVATIVIGIIFVAWLWAISAHIFSRATNTSFGFGLLIALGYGAFALGIVMLLGALFGALFAVGGMGFLAGISGVFYQLGIH